MPGPFRWLAASILALAASGAWAQGGRISFSGAVVEPTCAADVAAAGSPSTAVNPAPTHLSCGATATDPGRSYSRTVIELDAAVAASDRLLGYFASYANTSVAGGVPTKVLVHTYE